MIWGRTLSNVAMSVLSLFGALGCPGPFSGSAAMRIEVEVYKGPLSEEPELQFARLLGDLYEARKGIIETENVTRAIIANQDFKGALNGNTDSWPLPRIGQQDSIAAEVQSAIDEVGREVDKLQGPTDDQKMQLKKKFLEVAVKRNNAEQIDRLCKYVKPTGFWGQIDHFDCLILITLASETEDLRERVNAIDRDFPGWISQDGEAALLIPSGEPSEWKKKVESFLNRVSRLAAVMKDKAFRWAIASTAGQALDFKIRIATVNSIVVASEYSNQLEARADALRKQMIGQTGRDRRELTPSAFLREAEPTDFVHLYDWYDASSDQALLGIVSTARAVGSSLFWNESSAFSVEDRIKVVDRLFGNRYWSKINTVYASGRGKVSMAFVKDDVGNWNLKSFDNDPEELLKAYNDFAIKAIKKAAEIAQDIGTSGVSAGTRTTMKQLLENANEVALSAPSMSPGETGRLGVDGLHKWVTTKLTKRAAEFEVEDKPIRDNYEKAKEGEEKSQIAQLLAKNRRGYIEEYEKILSDYSKLLDSVAKEEVGP